MVAPCAAFSLQACRCFSTPAQFPEVGKTEYLLHVGMGSIFASSQGEQVMRFSQETREEFQNLIVDLYVDHVLPTDAHLTTAGHLWRCTDMLPGSDCETMDMPRGSTYAQAARQVKKDIPVLRRNWEQCQHNQREHVSV